MDVTPRRCQHFTPRLGGTIKWINTAGGSRTVTVDERGLVTATSVKIKRGEETVLTIKK